MKQLLFLLCFLCAAAGAGQVIGQGFTPGVGAENGPVDSTRLVQDSILQYWKNGLVVGRDTIQGGRGPVGPVGLTGPIGPIGLTGLTGPIGPGNTKYKGQFSSSLILDSSVSSPVIGDIADVENGASVERWKYDGTNWVVSTGTPSAETPSSVLQKLLANDNTNNYTDQEKRVVSQAGSRAIIALQDTSINLFRFENSIFDTQIQTTTGEIITSTLGIGISGPIYLPPNMSFSVQGRHPTRLDIHAYRDDSTWISRLSSIQIDGKEVYTSPPGTSYINANIWQNSESQFGETIRFNFFDTGQDEIFEQSNDIVNVFNSTNVVLDEYVASNGTIITNSTADGWIRTGPVRVFGSQTLLVSGQNTRFDVREFRADGTWIRTSTLVQNGASISVAMSENTDYILCNISQDRATDGDVINRLVILGSSPDTRKIKKVLIPDAIPDSTELGNLAVSPVFRSRRKATLSWVFDDDSTSDVLVLNAFREVNFQPSFAPISGGLTTNQAEFYKQAYDQGASILSHSVTHPGMSTTSISASVVEDEMRNSKNYFEGLGIRISGWVTPQSQLHPNFLPIAEKYFGYAFTSLGGNNTGPTVDPVELTRFSVEGLDQSNQDIKDRIDQAITNDELLVLYAHSIPSTNTDTDGATRFSEADLNEILLYIRDKTENGWCDFLPTDKAVSAYYINSQAGQELTGVGDANDPSSVPPLSQVQGIIANFILSGTGIPEGAITAPPGTLYLNTSGGPNNTLFVKESGTGNTGWVAK